MPKHNCGFVCFNSREAAQKCIETLSDKLYIGDLKLQVIWAKSQLQETKKKPLVAYVSESESN
jgi:RNA recognition motif-containing protein